MCSISLLWVYNFEVHFATRITLTQTLDVSTQTQHVNWCAMYFWTKAFYVIMSISCFRHQITLKLKTYWYFWMIEWDLFLNSLICYSKLNPICFIFLTAPKVAVWVGWYAWYTNAEEDHQGKKTFPLKKGKLHGFSGGKNP